MVPGDQISVRIDVLYQATISLVFGQMGNNQTLTSDQNITEGGIEIKAVYPDNIYMVLFSTGKGT